MTLAVRPVHRIDARPSWTPKRHQDEKKDCQVLLTKMKTRLFCPGFQSPLQTSWRLASHCLAPAARAQIASVPRASSCTAWVRSHCLLGIGASLATPILRVFCDWAGVYLDAGTCSPQEICAQIWQAFSSFLLATGTRQTLWWNLSSSTVSTWDVCFLLMEGAIPNLTHTTLHQYAASGWTSSVFALTHLPCHSITAWPVILSATLAIHDADSNIGNPWARGGEGGLAELPRATRSRPNPRRIFHFILSFELRQLQLAQNTNKRNIRIPSQHFRRKSRFARIAAAATREKKKLLMRTAAAATEGYGTVKDR